MQSAVEYFNDLERTYDDLKKTPFFENYRTGKENNVMNTTQLSQIKAIIQALQHGLLNAEGMINYEKDQYMSRCQKIRLALNFMIGYIVDFEEAHKPNATTQVDDGPAINDYPQEISIDQGPGTPPATDNVITPDHQ